MTDRIGIADNYSDCTGEGLEYVVVNDTVVCKFYDGMIIRENDKPVDRETETI